MMQTPKAKLEVGGQTFGLRWDMHAVATLERMTGESVMMGDGIEITAGNLLAVLWSCVDSDAASRDEEAPVSFRRFGTLFASMEEMQEAAQLAVDLIAESTGSGKANRAARRAAPKKKSPRKGSTSGARSTSASASASSGD